MDTNTILIFAQRIIKTCSDRKIKQTLSELKSLLASQGAPFSDLNMLQAMIDNIPEMKVAVHNTEVLTKQDVEIAERRAEDRRIRERAAMRMGRC